MYIDIGIDQLNFDSLSIQSLVVKSTPTMQFLKDHEIFLGTISRLGKLGFLGRRGSLGGSRGWDQGVVMV